MTAEISQKIETILTLDCPSIEKLLYDLAGNRDVEKNDTVFGLIATTLDLFKAIPEKLEQARENMTADNISAVAEDQCSTVTCVLEALCELPHVVNHSNLSESASTILSRVYELANELDEAAGELPGPATA